MTTMLTIIRQSPGGHSVHIADAHTIPAATCTHMCVSAIYGLMLCLIIYPATACLPVRASVDASVSMALVSLGQLQTCTRWAT